VPRHDNERDGELDDHQREEEWVGEPTARMDRTRLQAATNHTAQMMATAPRTASRS
jgi:hypothetical protein